MTPKILTAPLFALALILSPQLDAQEADPFSDAPAEAEIAAAPATAPAKFDLHFEGASVSEACEFIRLKLDELDDAPFNIVVSKEAADIVLPSMQLRQITFEQFARFINRIGGASEDGGFADDPFAAGGHEHIPRKGERFGISDTEGIWYFWAERVPESTKTDPSEKIMTRTFHVGEEADPTLSLIEEALAATKTNGNKKETKLAFHEATKSLIVSGHPEDLELVADVVSSTREIQTAENQSALRKEIEIYRRDLEEMGRKMEFQNRMAEEEKIQIKRQLEAHILQLETQLVEAKAQFGAAHPKIQELQIRLAEALAQLGAKE